jgi:hypothetical protein
MIKIVLNQKLSRKKKENKLMWFKIDHKREKKIIKIIFKKNKIKL